MQTFLRAIKILGIIVGTIIGCTAFLVGVGYLLIYTGAVTYF